MEDILTVNYDSTEVNFKLSYGYLDKIYEAFNFKTKQNESVEKFILNLNNEAMPDNQYLLLEDMSNRENALYDVKLSIDGLEYKGLGKISKFFSENGLNINLHLLEDN